MKKLLVIITTIALLCTCAIANAAYTTITFSGSDIVSYAPLSPINSSGTPVVGDGYIETATAVITTYDRSSGTAGNPAAFNSWLSGLGNTEGISSFNLWLQDGNSNQAAMWGETIWLTDAYSNSINPFASAGWTATVYTIGDEWGSSWKGRKLITYTATSSEYYLRPGSNASFGFTADTNAAADNTYSMWVGSDTVVGHNGEGLFQRSITANAVPEPMSIILGIMGLGSVVGFRKFRK